MEQSLEMMTKKLWIMHECRNQMGRYQFLHSSKQHEATVALFASRDDCWIENNDLGFFRGHEGIKRFFVDFHKKMDGDDLRGSFCQHDLTTEVMEVADDLKTCKACWLSPGVETRKDPETGELTSYWCWVKYAVDFTEDNGEWKFWHFTIFSDFFCDYYTAWVDVPYTTSATDDMLAPDELITGEKSYVYTRDTVPPLWPKTPVPYASYDKNTMTERQE